MREPARVAADLAPTLGHAFADPALLVEALTHASALPRAGARRPAGKGRPLAGYERLEFLGDRVLGLVIAELLWRRFPDEAEGPLTRRHTHLVRRDALAEVARRIGLGGHIILSAGEAAAATPESAGVLADSLEAVIAALYIDGGIGVAAAFIARHWEPLLAAAPTAPRDPKTALQEWAQARGRKLPLYETRKVEGPPHRQRFTIAVTVEGEAPEAAEGSSKRGAESAAAAALLARLRAAAPEPQRRPARKRHAKPAAAPEAKIEESGT